MPPPKLNLTTAEKRRRMKRRRILQLTAVGWTPAMIAADPKIKYTPARVRQILAELKARHQAGGGPWD